jgi:hypothetical protein
MSTLTNKEYNKMVVLTYAYYDPELRPFLRENFDLNDVEEYEEMSEFIYQNEVLNVFSLPGFHFNMPENVVSTLFKELREEMEEPILLMKKKNSCNEVDSFFYLFSYDYFFLTHVCICDFLRDGKIKPENLELLISRINSE